MQKGLELEERDFFDNPFTEEELRHLLGDTPPSDVFSWKSPSFKKLGLSQEELDDDRLIALMLQEPRLIRRPLIHTGDRLIVGANKKAIEDAFPG